MANTSEIKNGLCLNFNNDVWKVVEFLHVKPGKGPAFVRCKLKSLTSGKVVDNTWPSSHKIDIVRVERRVYQFLYKDEMGYNFMDTENYEQTTLDEKLLDNPKLLKESAVVDILFDADKDMALTLEMPQYIEMEITYTEPGDRGNTSSSNVMKPATTETGAEIKVPLFINIGDRVKLDSATASYVERVK
ncbi:MAG: elongation factor P [Saprospiraceae bacterium]|jgi:elongation factor P